ncbi:MAG: hypothetical protein E6H57_18085, partial [Betaproteobacteria bacterium]
MAIAWATTASIGLESSTRRSVGATQLQGATEIYLSRPWLAHYEPGVPADVEVPLKTVPEAFDEATARAPERTAVVFYGRAITYRELREATDRLACALARLGLKKGERVALYLLNSPQFIIAY